MDVPHIDRPCSLLVVSAVALLTTMCAPRPAPVASPSPSPAPASPPPAPSAAYVPFAAPGARPSPGACGGLMSHYPNSTVVLEWQDDAPPPLPDRVLLRVEHWTVGQYSHRYMSGWVIDDGRLYLTAEHEPIAGRLASHATPSCQLDRATLDGLRDALLAPVQVTDTMLPPPVDESVVVPDFFALPSFVGRRSVAYQEPVCLPPAAPTELVTAVPQTPLLFPREHVRLHAQVGRRSHALEVINAPLAMDAVLRLIGPLERRCPMFRQRYGEAGALVN